MVELLEDNNFYYIDLYPSTASSFSKEVDGLKVDFCYVDNQFQIKKVAYPKSKYKIDDVLEKVKNVMKLNEKNLCPTCRSLNRLRELAKAEFKQAHEHSQSPLNLDFIKKDTTKAYTTQPHTTSENKIEILPTLLKSLIDIPSQVILTQTGRKIAKGFFALLAFLGSSLTKSEVEKELLDKMFFSFVEDLSLKNKDELKYITKDLNRLSKGLKYNNTNYIKSAFIKTPEMLEKYLQAIEGKKEKTQKIVKRKFI